MEVQGNSGPTAKFSGGTGFLIENAGTDWSHPSLHVNAGTGRLHAAWFEGGGGVFIKNVANDGHGLTVDMGNATGYSGQFNGGNGVKIGSVRSEAEYALEVKGEIKCDKLRIGNVVLTYQDGKLHIDEDVHVKGAIYNINHKVYTSEVQCFKHNVNDGYMGYTADGKADHRR